MPVVPSAVRLTKPSSVDDYDVTHGPAAHTTGHILSARFSQGFAHAPFGRHSPGICRRRHPGEAGEDCTTPTLSEVIARPTMNNAQMASTVSRAPTIVRGVGGLLAGLHLDPVLRTWVAAETTARGPVVGPDGRRCACAPGEPHRPADRVVQDTAAGRRRGR